VQSCSLMKSPAREHYYPASLLCPSPPTPFPGAASPSQISRLGLFLVCFFLAI
jgi:hypothetical protein